MLGGVPGNKNKKHLSQAGALIRSGWEDAHQNRRKLLAGKGKAALDARIDDQRPRLLTKEEEEKTRKFHPRPVITKDTVNQWRGRGRYRSTSRHNQGKGKGSRGSKGGKGQAAQT